MTDSVKSVSHKWIQNVFVLFVEPSSIVSSSRSVFFSSDYSLSASFVLETLERRRKNAKGAGVGLIGGKHFGSRLKIIQQGVPNLWLGPLILHL